MLPLLFPAKQLYDITENASKLVDEYVEKHAREKPVPPSNSKDIDKRGVSDRLLIQKNDV
jgi:hypothetical protein